MGCSSCGKRRREFQEMIRNTVQNNTVQNNTVQNNTVQQPLALPKSDKHTRAMARRARAMARRARAIAREERIRLRNERINSRRNKKLGLVNNRGNSN